MDEGRRLGGGGGRAADRAARPPGPASRRMLTQRHLERMGPGGGCQLAKCKDFGDWRTGPILLGEDRRRHRALTRRAGCNQAPARATRRRARPLGSVGWRSSRGSSACTGLIAATDAGRPLRCAPSSARANMVPLVSVTMNSARLPTNTHCTMAGTPATTPAATPPVPSNVANNRTARSRNIASNLSFATSALVESCPVDEARNNRFFAESEVGNSCVVVGRRLTAVSGVRIGWLEGRLASRCASIVRPVSAAFEPTIPDRKL
jgi:hypothetical protein